MSENSNEANPTVIMLERCNLPSGEHCSEADRAAETAVRKTFAIMGVNIDEPKEVAAFQEGLRFGRTLNNLANKSIYGTAAALCTLIVAYVWKLLTSE